MEKEEKRGGGSVPLQPPPRRFVRRPSVKGAKTFHPPLTSSLLSLVLSLIPLAIKATRLEAAELGKCGRQTLNRAYRPCTGVKNGTGRDGMVWNERQTT